MASSWERQRALLDQRTQDVQEHCLVPSRASALRVRFGTSRHLQTLHHPPSCPTDSRGSEPARVTHGRYRCARSSASSPRPAPRSAAASPPRGLSPGWGLTALSFPSCDGLRRSRFGSHTSRISDGFSVSVRHHVLMRKRIFEGSYGPHRPAPPHGFLGKSWARPLLVAIPGRVPNLKTTHSNGRHATMMGRSG